VTPQEFWDDTRPRPSIIAFQTDLTGETPSFPWGSVEVFAAKAYRRLATIAFQGQQAIELAERSPVDVSAIVGGVLLLGTAVARGVMSVLALAMSSPGFQSQNLAFQGRIGALARSAASIRGEMGSFAASRRMPTIEGLVHVFDGLPTPNARGTGISSAMEKAFNAPATLGVSFDLFWSITPEGRESLGRLIAVDPVLDRNYDFDPLTEGVAVMDDIVPTVVNADPIIKRFSDAGTTPQKTVVTSLPVTITQGMTLAALAAKVLGDAEAWRRIAAFNDLRFPYISSDPTDRLGNPLGPAMLAAPATLGSRTLVLTSVQGIYPDVRILIKNGFHSDTVTVTDVITGSSTVFIKEALSRDYPRQSTLTLYPPSYDIQGQVLSPGDVLLIPLVEVAHALGITGLRISPHRDPRAMYGIDVAVTPVGEVMLDEKAGDLMLRGGPDNLKQALIDRLRTTRGSLPYHMLYGFNLEPFIGFRSAPIFPFFAAFEGRQSFLADPRVLSVDTINARISGDTLLLDFSLTTTADQKFPGQVQVKVD
jgi:hypothetical protein